MRIGHGYDVHRLIKGRDLFIGGVLIPYDKGLEGHSDADVLIHAVCDSLLGAASLGDIGRHFPDSDSKYKDISSIILLKNVVKLLKEKHYKVVNIDATVIAQSPKLSPYIEKMVNNIADAIDIDSERINIKATTEEHLGFTGSGEGIAAHAVCLINNE